MKFINYKKIRDISELKNTSLGEIVIFNSDKIQCAEVNCNQCIFYKYGNDSCYFIGKTNDCVCIPSNRRDGLSVSFIKVK